MTRAFPIGVGGSSRHFRSERLRQPRPTLPDFTRDLGTP
jgi:hypothetical protein